jgi:hypothetical protein
LVLVTARKKSYAELFAVHIEGFKLTLRGRVSYRYGERLGRNIVVGGCEC